MAKFSKASQKNYKKSNKIRHKISVIPIATKNLYQKLRNQKSITELQLQKLSDSICKVFGAPNTKITFAGKQPHRTNSKRLKWKKLGIKRHGLRNDIQIYKFTAVRGKQLSPKTAISTLIHELNHHFDYQLYQLSRSIHCSGFYRRIGQVVELLKN